MSAGREGAAGAGRDVAAAAANHAIGVALATGGVLAFSLRPVLVRFAYAYVTDPVTLLALRMVFALPFFLAAAFWAGRDKAAPRLSPRDALHVAVLGFLGYYLASYLDFLGLQYVSAGLGRLMLFLYPTIVVILSAIFLGKRVGRIEIAALALTYGGVALVVSGSLGGESSNLPLGAALVFASSIVYAVYLVAGSQVVRRLGTLRFSAYALIVSSVLAIGQYLVLRPPGLILELPGEVHATMFVMAVGCTVLPVFMTSEALRRIGASLVAMLGALGPVSAALFGYLGLDERMSLVQIAGGVLVVAGVLLVSVKRG